MPIYRNEISVTPALTIVIPTVCSEARANSLLRAIESARSSSKEPLIVLVVANGPQVSDGLYAGIEKLPDVTCLRLPDGSLPLALLAGRSHVNTEFFSFLDDDDELLPGSSDARLEVLREDPTADVSVLNGYREIAGSLTLMNPNMQGIDDAPLKMILKRNWFASCSSVFRTATVGVEMFEAPQAYAEWTWLALRLSLMNRKFVAIDSPGYVVHDTPLSLSKSRRYVESYVGLFDRMLEEDLPDWARRCVVSKRCDALHDLSHQALHTGDHLRAWSMHLKSLRSFRGLKYIFYTRHLLVGLMLRRHPSES